MDSTIIKNMFLGTALGDAFGAGLEFQDRNWIRENIDFTKFVNKRSDINTPEKDLFTINYKEWDYTDDTEMAIAVTKAIMSTAPFEEDMLVNSFLEEYNLGYKLKGYKRNGHGAIRWFFNGEKSIQEIRDFQTTRQYPGNAPPMRAMPIGFLHESLIDKYAAINARSTHPHPKAIDASILVARATEGLLVKGVCKEDLIKYCLPFIIDEETILLLKQVEGLPHFEMLVDAHFEILCGPQPLTKSNFIDGLLGLPSNAMYTAVSALYIIKHAESAYEALKYSVYTGGDVDSLAAITVGITAGKYGVSSIPTYMLDNVEGKRYIEEIGSLYHNYLIRK